MRSEPRSSRSRRAPAPWTRGRAFTSAIFLSLLTIALVAKPGAADSTAPADTARADSTLLRIEPGPAPEPDSPEDLVESIRARPDSALLRLELGATTDFTNELFYEDAFVDTIALGRRLVSSPESRVAGVLLASWSGTRSAQRTNWSVVNELSLGDKIRRDAAAATWRSQFAPEWRAYATPRLEYRRDLTFDRDLEEWRGSFSGRLRRSLGDGSTAAEGGLGGDFLRTSGTGAEFLPDRNTGRGSFAIEHAPLLGSEWRAGYGLTLRQFPDSTVRDHVEHGGEGRWKHEFSGGRSFLLEGTGIRRSTLDPAPTSRDNFWEIEGASELEARLGEAAALRARVEIETIHYDREDTAAFFNYRILRARFGPRIERTSWNVSLGPRAEMLQSESEPGEEYREIAGFIELETFGGGAWWNLAPVAGWRDYTSTAPSDPFAVPALHSSYAFYELTVIGEQPLVRGTRLRVSGTGRFEAHVDESQDARSLYFSVDVRKIF